MIITNADQTEIYFACDEARIYIGADGLSLRIASGTARGGLLERYPSTDMARAAVRMIANNLRNDAVVVTPSAAQVEQRTRSVEHDRYRNGKKSKGHGGS